MELLVPPQGICLDGHKFLGRGSRATGEGGWHLAGHAFRCARCGDLIPVGFIDDFCCSCGALFMDPDYFRLGSDLGDQNILVYQTAQGCQAGGDSQPRAGGMVLELASGRIIHDATAEDILAHIDGEEFAILSIAPETYIQCAGQKEPPYEFELEYREGSKDRHYRAADGPITIDRVIAAFLGYLQGDPAWRFRFRWEQMEFSGA